jgi:two-component system phosphate regulon sensor histidine kinase PhoR
LDNPWIREFWRIGALAALTVLIGSLTGQMLWSFFILVLGYLLWHLRNLYKLERWYAAGQKEDPPDASGIWGEVFYHTYRLRQKSRSSKAKLANILKRFQKSTSAMPDATVVLNESGEIEWFNKAAKRYLGLKKKKDRGQRVDNLIRYPRFVRLLNSEDFDEPVVIPSPVNHDLLLSVRLVPYARQQILLVARDVTRVQQLEQMRRDFIANISHELKTPLTVMSGYLENIIDDGDYTNGPFGKALQQMQQQASRMGRIVDDLLMLSRLETGENNVPPEPVAVPVIVSSLFEDAEWLAKERGQTLTLDVDYDLWLLGNEKELHSAFSNLVHNAVKYTPEGGEINVRWFHDEEAAYFQVQDNGVGISVDHIPRLTERFYRVDPGRSREQGGTGLGLAIVKHVLNRHEARLKIQSEPGQGSTFTCVFSVKRIARKREKMEQKAS